MIHNNLHCAERRSPSVCASVSSKGNTVCRAHQKGMGHQSFLLVTLMRAVLPLCRSPPSRLPATLGSEHLAPWLRTACREGA